MSRLEEALRRSRSAQLATSVSSDEPAFESPWTFQSGLESAGSRPTEARVTSVERSREVPPPPDDVVQGFNPEWRERLAVAGQGDRRLVEEFRRLAATLHQAQMAANAHAVMVTSASAGDGKTLTAINLSLILSDSYRKSVLLIDADLRRPSIRDVSHMANAIGLGEALRSTTESRLTVLRISDRLSLLPAGAPDPDPLGGLTSPRMRQIIGEAVRRFDWVIIDAPPVAHMADTRLLADMVDASLIVVRAATTSYGAVQKAIETIGRERILGVVLNACDPKDMEAGDASYYYEQPARAKGL